MSTKSKSKSSSKSSKSSKKKGNFATIGQYLVAKNKKTKYLKLGTGPKASKEVKLLVKKLIAALGTDVMYVNIFDEAFRDKYDIKDFVKGSVSINLDSRQESEEEDDEDEDSEEESDDDSEDEEDSDDDSDDEDDLDF